MHIKASSRVLSSTRPIHLSSLFLLSSLVRRAYFTFLTGLTSSKIFVISSSVYISLAMFDKCKVLDGGLMDIFLSLNLYDFGLGTNN